MSITFKCDICGKEIDNSKSWVCGDVIFMPHRKDETLYYTAQIGKNVIEIKFREDKHFCLPCLKKCLEKTDEKAQA